MMLHFVASTSLPPHCRAQFEKHKIGKISKISSVSRVLSLSGVDGSLDSFSHEVFCYNDAYILCFYTHLK